MTVQENVPLGPLTTLQVGGPARYFIEAASPDDVGEAVAFSISKRLSLFAMGGGSNLVVSDAGWPGVLLRIAISGIVQTSPGHFDVGAGESWDAFVAHSIAEGCAGIECLSGIPGTVGGTPIQNVGAYGQEVASTIVGVQVFDKRNNDVRELSNAECGFGYRSSIFSTRAINGGAAGRYIVLRVAFQLHARGAPHVEYADLRARFTTPPSLQQVRDTVREIRASKGMLLDPDFRSVGSFFKNPIVPVAQYQQMVKDHEMPHWPAGLNLLKLSAAWLVEHAGFPKGFARGPVGISTRHSLAIVNLGGATAQDIVALKNDIVEKVDARFHVVLQPEPVFLGEF